MITFYANNLVDQATITASSTNAQFPVSNLKDPRRTKVFRSTSNTTSVVFDLMETSDIDAFILVSNPILGFGFSTVTIEANGTDSWSSPAFTTSFSFSTKHGIGIKDLDAVISYRFVRFSFTSTLGFVEVANVFIGKKSQTNRGISYNWTYKDEDISKQAENRYGQKFVDIIGRQREFSGAIQNLDKDNLDIFFETYDLKGKSHPFFIKIGDSAIMNEVERYSAMVYFKSMPTISNRFFNNYSLSIQLEEAK